jgi:DNA-binding MarR family transcriptional regulator
MNTYAHVPSPDFIFGALLIIANRMDTLLERTLSKHQITAKQWFLLMVLMSQTGPSLTLKEAAAVMGTSHQNVKMLATKLQSKGMLELKKDPKDLRTTRLHLTALSRTFWIETESDGLAFMASLYEGTPFLEYDQMRQFLTRLMDNLDRMAINIKSPHDAETLEESE